MSNIFTPLQDNDNIVDGVNNLEAEVTAKFEEILEPQPAIADAAGDGSDAAAKLNEILATLRTKGIIET